MFTGIVQARGRVASFSHNAFGARLVVDRSQWRPPGVTLGHGDSVCVSGVCLTATRIEERTVAFDVIAETLSKTTLGRLAPGREVNLEASLTPTTQIGGHFVQGHVDGVGEVAAVHAGREEWRLTLRPPADLLEYVVPKGSVAIDGVSLTVARAAADSNTFEVALIPTTLDLTTLGALKAGDAVNLETDIVSKTIVHWLRRQRAGGGVNMESLRRAGFAE